MISLLAAFWPGLAGAIVLGCAVGFVSGWPSDRGMPLVLAGLCVLLMLPAMLQVVPGVPGLWLEAGALMLPFYLGGCAIGALGNRGHSAEG